MRTRPLDISPKESQRDTGTAHSSLPHKPLKLLIQPQNDFISQDALHCQQGSSTKQPHWPLRVVLYGCLSNFDHTFNHLSISPLGQRPENMASTSFSIPYGLPKARHRECILLTIQMRSPWS